MNHISLMSPRAHASRGKIALEKAASRLGARRVELDDQVAKVSVIGTGFRHHPWVPAKVFESLAKNRINIEMIMTSDLRISVVVSAKDGQKALRAIHKAFGLSRKKR